LKHGRNGGKKIGKEGKRTGLETWQKWWEEDRKGRTYYKLQKSVILKITWKKTGERKL